MNTARNLARLFAIWGLLLLAAIGWKTMGNTRAFAAFEMLTGLALLWSIALGGFFYYFRDPIRAAARSITDEHLRFLVVAGILLLIFEAAATWMTDLGPAFGVPLGAVSITVSANYLAVLLRHGLLLFLPMLIVWAYVFLKQGFTAVESFLLFGIAGTIAESTISGPGAIIGMGYWVWIYGFLAYLPVYVSGKDTEARKTFAQYLVAIILPLAAGLAISFIASGF